MSEFWLIVIVIAALWIFFSMRPKTKETKTIRAFNALDLAKPWFEEQGIDSGSVMFGTYEDVSLARNSGTTVLAGNGETSKGGNIGFALEIDPSRGVVDHEILVPYGIASWHKKASVQAKIIGKPLLDVLVAMAADHRARLKPTVKDEGPTNENKLIAAAWEGDNNLVMQLLDKGVETSKSDSSLWGATALHFAAVNGCIDVAKTLLTHRANARAVTEYDETPLHWAVDISELIFEAMLSRGANHRIRNHKGATSLHLSVAAISNIQERCGIILDDLKQGEVYWGDFNPKPEKIAGLCLSAGIDVNDVDYQGKTALHWACSLPSYQDCYERGRGTASITNDKLVDLLISSGTDLEQKDAKGLRPIDYAALELKVNFCKKLINAGSPLPCLSSEFEDVALFLKSKINHSSCVALANLFLEYDLFPNEDSRIQLYEEFQRIRIQNEKNSELYSSVCFTEFDLPARELDSTPVIELIDMLLKYKVNIDAISKTGDTALLVSAGAGSISMKKLGRTGIRDNFCRGDIG
jgi:ankyrin repeat protein